MKRLNTILTIVCITVFAFGFILKTQSQNNGGVNVGDKAIDLAFNSPEGKTLKLSELKGKIVLLDFWASWCRPCRLENPNVVAAYNKYKNAKFKKAKGFAIYSVSLDQDKNAWTNAINQDGLSWTTHVSDLGGWRSKAAAMYRVNSIPTNWLIDENGTIIAIGLRGPALEAALDQLVASKKTHEAAPQK